MKKFALLLICGLCVSSLAKANKIELNPIAFDFDYDGQEAKALYNAFSAAGITPVADPNAGGFRIDVVKVEVDGRTNAGLDPTDPCYSKASYSVTIAPGRDKAGSPVTINETSNCNGTIAKGVFDALSAVGGNQVTGVAMGSFELVASGIYVGYNSKRNGDFQYVSLGTVGQ